MSLLLAAASVFRALQRLYCLYHVGTNVQTHLRPILNSSWESFKRDFFVVYYAVSPDDFDRQWQGLIARYLAAEPYLQSELYPCRHRWAWPWVGYIFTAGVHTSGFVETENRIIKFTGVGPKTSAKQLYDMLNERTEAQLNHEILAV